MYQYVYFDQNEAPECKFDDPDCEDCKKYKSSEGCDAFEWVINDYPGYDMDHIMNEDAYGYDDEDYLDYYGPEEGKLYIIDKNSLIEWCEENNVCADVSR